MTDQFATTGNAPLTPPMAAPRRSLGGMVWRLLVAIKDGLALLALLLFFGALYMFLTAGPNPADNRGGALLLDLNGSIVEQPEAPDPRALLTGQVSVGNQFRTRDIVRALELAAQDDDIKTVVLDLGGFWGGGQATIDEIGDALAKVRAAKKPVYAHASAYTDDGYLLAAHATEIWLDPMGGAMFTGPGGSQPYFKGLIDRLGVTTHIYRVGKYKSFIEPYLLTQQSPEAKESSTALTGALWQSWQDDVARMRPAAKLKTYITDPAGTFAASGGDMAKAALSNGIIDKIGTRADFGKRIAALVGSDDSKPAGDFNNTALEDYLVANPASTSGDGIGVVTVAGSIVDGRAPMGTAGGTTISDLIDEAVAEGELKALVVRVDSGGGSAFASEEIRAALGRAKAKGLPVVASMGSVAASGGYWVAMAGDKVFAQPTTITGSIGVFGIIPTLENAIPKIGITADGVTTTPLSGQPDMLRGTNAQTDAVLQAGVENVYARFLNLVATRRKMPVARVNEIAQGRVWDGGTARQIGLVDAFGSIDDAIAEAARLAKLDPKSVHRVDIEPQQSIVDALLSNIGIAEPALEAEQDIFTRLIRREQARTVAGMNDAQSVLMGPAVQVRCMACPATPAPKGWTSLMALIKDKVFS
jgi:protease IV